MVHITLNQPRSPLSNIITFANVLSGGAMLRGRLFSFGQFKGICYGNHHP